MRFKTMSLALAASLPVQCLIPAVAMARPQGELSRPIAVDIRAGSLSKSIRDLARTANAQVLAKPELLRGKRNDAVRGTMTVVEAIHRLLRGSDLTMRMDGSIIMIVGSTDGGEKAAAAVDTSDILVTGMRFQNRAEINNRRKATTVVDTLTQDDTGNLADQSIAEALRRIPAVATIYDEDEGQFVAIRGVQSNLIATTVDGLTMASVGKAGGGARQVDLSLIPSQSARTTEVYKTFTSDLDGGAIGGVLNIVPRSAYDTKRPTLFIFDAFTNYFTFGDVPGVNSIHDPKDSHFGGGFNMTYAHRFGSADQFGIVLAANYQQKQRDETKPNAPSWSYFNDAGKPTTPDSPDWNGIAAPSQFVDYNFTDRIRNAGVSARFEFQPSTKFYSSLLLYGYSQGESETRNTNNLVSFDQPKNITRDGGDYRVKDSRLDYLTDTFDRDTRGAQFRTAYRPDAKSIIDFRAGYSYSAYSNFAPEISYDYLPNTGIHIDTTGDIPSFTLTNPDNYMNPSLYSLRLAQILEEKSYSDVYEGKLDFRRNMDEDSVGFGVEAGVDWRDLTLERDNTYINYTSDKSLMTNVGVDPNYIPMNWPAPVLWINGDAFWNTVAPKLKVNAKTSATNSLGDDFRYEEVISAAYAAVAYSTGPLRISAGGRFDRAVVKSHVPATVNGVVAFTDADGSYQHFLPSANLLWKVTDTNRVKASYSRTIGRPNPNDVAKPETRDDQDLTISRGNPNIKPRIADNYDIAFEHYFNGSNGALTLGFYDKEIKGDIFALATQQDVDGVTYTVTQPMNAERSSLRGIEFGFIDNRIPLPLIGDHLGVSLNATRVWGNMRYQIAGVETVLNRLPFQMDWLGNAAIFYALPHNGEIRAAVSYESAYMDTIGAQTYLREGWRPLATVDVTLRQEIMKNVIIKLQARNLTGANRIGVIGRNLEYRAHEIEFGRSFYFNLIYRL